MCIFSFFVKSPSRLPRCQSGFGCFKACPQPTCDSVVLWRRTGNYVDFRIKARLTSPSNRWVAIGFSPSGKMVGRIFSYILVFLIYWMKCKSQGHTSVLNLYETVDWFFFKKVSISSLLNSVRETIFSLTLNCVLIFQSRTSVVMCINDNSNLRVEDGFNNGYSFQPLANVSHS